jgi:phospholipase C
MWGAACAAVLISCAAAAGAGSASAAAPEGIQKIQHVVMIMQENRSFDTYFGTYPGADGIPPGVCVPEHEGPCVQPFHNPNDKNWGGPHGHRAAVSDVNGGLMNGFLTTAYKPAAQCTSWSPRCTCPTISDCTELVGYHDARELPNYWTYAKDFVLQDHMFESASAWSQPEHNFLVSGWAGWCPETNPDPFACAGSVIKASPTRNWTDLTYLLHRAGVSWRYYVYEGPEPDCINDEALTCETVIQTPQTPGSWNPLAGFVDVREDGQLENIVAIDKLWTAVHETATCGLPNVSWVTPNGTVSEHPPALLSSGQAYVTTIINAIMRSPCWPTTAIFLSWDDWGGYYDHVPPPPIDTLGYGLRVPGLVISPYARAGYVDRQQLSHDAYLKFIEDDFLGGERLNPRTDGRPDPRVDVREEASGLGSLQSDFNFEQEPRGPVLLPTTPGAGAASPAPGAPAPPALETAAPAPIGPTSATLQGTVDPDGTLVGSCRFEYGTTSSYGSSAPCATAPGEGTAPVAESSEVEGLAPDTTYHFRIVAANAAGSQTGPDLTFTTAIEGF